MSNMIKMDTKLFTINYIPFLLFRHEHILYHYIFRHNEADNAVF